MTTLQELDEVLAKVERMDTSYPTGLGEGELERVITPKAAAYIRAALELQAKLEQGFVLVPREPTPEMMQMGVRMFGRPEFNAESISTVYRHMLKAAPPAQGEVSPSMKKHDGPCWRNNYSDCGC